MAGTSTSQSQNTSGSQSTGTSQSTGSSSSIGGSSSLGTSNSVSGSTAVGGSASLGQSQSISRAQSTTSVLDYPERAFLDSIMTYAGTAGQNVFNWAQGAYAKNSALTDANINNYLNTSQTALNQANQYQNIYNQTALPEAEKIIHEGDTYASPEQQLLDMGAAESGQMQGGEAAKQNAIRDLQAYGIDPSSGRYAALDRAAEVSSAAAAVGAAQQARQFDINTGHELQQQGLNQLNNATATFGGQTTNATNTALQGFAGAENAGLANTNTGATAFGAANPFLNTATNYKPITGVNSFSNSDASSLNQANSFNNASSFGNSSSLSQSNSFNQAQSQNQATSYNQATSASQGTSSSNSVTTDPAGSGSGSGSKQPTSPQQQSGSASDPMYTSGTGSGTGSSGSLRIDVPSTGIDPYSSGDVFSTGSDPYSGGYIGDNGVGGGLYSSDPYTSAYPTDTIGGSYDPASQSSLDSYSSSGGFGDVPYIQSSGSGGDSGLGFDTGASGVSEYEEGGPVDDDTSGIPEDGGAIPTSASPSGGRMVDDVAAKGPSGPINVNADEFVIPRDVALWKGQEFFQKLIMQSRQARVMAPAKPSRGAPAQRMQ